MFNLSLDRRGRDGDAMGEIVIGEYRETLLVDLSYWDFSDYHASWLRSAAHVLEHGYGRFLMSVNTPGEGLYITWPCRLRGPEVIVFKSFLLSSYTETFRRPEEAETPAEDYATRNEDEPNIDLHRCSLRDIADFEARLRGASAH